MRAIGIAVAAAFVLSAAPTAAQQSEIGYPEGSLAFQALAAGDYAKAERQLRKSAVDRNDPALLINLGQLYARTNRPSEAADMFRRAYQAEEIELVLRSGRPMSSREAAARALRALEQRYGR